MRMCHLHPRLNFSAFFLWYSILNFPVIYHRSKWKWNYWRMSVGSLVQNSSQLRLINDYFFPFTIKNLIIGCGNKSPLPEEQCQVETITTKIGPIATMRPLVNLKLNWSQGRWNQGGQGGGGQVPPARFWQYQKPKHFLQKAFYLDLYLEK